MEQQLQADVVAPAESQCQQSIALAKGNAAQIIEQGRAQAEGLQQLAESWKAAGPNAKEVFLFPKLDVLLKALSAGFPEVDVQNVTVIDSSQSNNGILQNASLIEQLRQATGIDVTDLINRFGAGKVVDVAAERGDD